MAPLTLDRVRVQKEADELIALLDRFLFLRGITLASHQPNLATVFEELSNPAPCPAVDDYVPPSLRLHPAVDLQDHLDDQRREQLELKELPARISALGLDSAVRGEVKRRIATEYGMAKPSFDIRAFGHKAIPEMLAELRAAQKQPQQPVPTFAISLVATVLMDGWVDEMRTYHLPRISSWKFAQERLTVMSRSWQAHDAGHPHGYDLRDGKWLYQVSKDQQLVSDMLDLVTANDYTRMRTKIEKENVTVVVWHEKVCAKAQALKIEAAALKDRRSENPADSPRNEDGSKYFLPDFDEWKDLPQIMKSEMQELPAPKSEPLSDDAQDPIVKRKRASRT